MRNFFCIVLLGMISIAIGKKKKRYKREDSVIVLSDDNFEKAIRHYKSLLVVFYASWCGHCSEFLPVYTKASLLLSSQKPRINLAKIEVSINQKTAKKYDIHSYPTLKLFKEGIPYNYTGPMSEIGIAKWMRKKILPALSELMTLSDISNFKNTHEISVVYFGNDKSHLAFLKDLAILDNDIFYGYCDFQTAYGVYSTRPGTIVLFKSFGEERTELSGKLSKDSIERFLSKFRVDKLLRFNEKTAMMIWRERNPGLFLFREENDRKTEIYDSVFKQVSEELFGKIKVVVTGIYSIEEQNMNTLTKVKPSELPTVRIYDPRKKPDAFYVMEGEITFDNVMKFYQDWTADKIPMALKSEDAITIQKGKVFEVVGKTFEKDVINNDLNVLVLFYSPYYEASKNFMSTYEEIAERFKKEKIKDLRVAMIDMSRNEVPLEKKIPSYPHLKFWAKTGEGNKIPVEYKGQLHKEDIVKFVYSNLGFDNEESSKIPTKDLILDDDKSDL